MLNIAIIGCGDMGNQHAAAWRARTDCRVIAVCDVQPDRLAKMVAKTGGRGHARWEDAVEQSDVQVVSVCVPVCLHAPISIHASQRKRHVLCEKPIALRLGDADAMIAAARDNGVLLSTSFQYRGFGRNVKLRELFHAGRFGGPLHARYVDVREVRPKLAMHRRSMNGGPVIDMASHFFDLMRFFTGEEPTRVFAQGHTFGEGKPRLAGIEDLAVDAASIEVQYTGGSILNAYVNWGMPEGFAEITSELFLGPTLSARNVGGNLELQHGSTTTLWERGSEPGPGPAVRVANLVDAINGVAALEVTGAEGRVALACSLAALESIQTGRPVDLAG